MKNLNSPEMVFVHKNALEEYMKYAICACQDCPYDKIPKGCKKSGCVIHRAETILEKDIYGGKSNGG